MKPGLPGKRFATIGSLKMPRRQFGHADYLVFHVTLPTTVPCPPPGLVTIVRSILKRWG